MRFSTALSLALAVSPAAVFAAGNLGFSLGVKKPDGKCKDRADFEKDFDTLKAHGTTVRTYAAADCGSASLILPAAKSKGFKVVLGIWPDVEESYKADVEALKKAVPGNEDVVAAITVGSETLYRGNFTGPELLKKINEVQKVFPKLTIGTADSWNKYADGTADALIEGGVKYLLVNAFAFWQGKAIEQAPKTLFDDLVGAAKRIADKAPKGSSPYVAIGETGWPTDGGTDYGAAKAGTKNAEKFYKEGVCAMLAWGVDVFYFEAFDEPWKPKSIGDNGNAADETHWGMYTADRKAKFNADCKVNKKKD
ncbi:GPI-anchored cell wall beta-1,3-endoglucanase EglC [Trichophyton verrucosum HKI 0517]|uniref:glucan 1,3-beta-glucosidase n=1 Tax=Trichophyton verrucosum (strain HKI 0517) TaxID=663202 RepID=D4D483_TRIVH|nr:GPI-anchored cell wall beta-1,3-endoglucanase EglC [Trichophyton verrucosum HKI 0517]EFE43338.1 GPI-anchored cell wall beta-1,3-endoglucanase EglC [Trichophyton verrucosum HKI 0517]